MIFWLVLGFVILTIFGSVYWLKPSPRDKRLAGLRYDAIKLGLQIRQFTFKPDSAKTGVRDEITATSYTLVRPGQQQGGALKFRVAGQAGWDTDGLPEGLCWHNQGTAADAEKWTAAMAQLSDDLLLLEVYENRVVLMPAERKTANAEAYKVFMQTFL